MDNICELFHELLIFVKFRLFCPDIFTILSLLHRALLSINLLTNQSFWCRIKLSSYEYFILQCTVYSRKRLLRWLCWNWYLGRYCRRCSRNYANNDPWRAYFTNHLYIHFMESNRLMHNYGHRFWAMYILYSSMVRFICCYGFRS